MKDQGKTREQLIAENEELRRRVAVLEKASQEDPEERYRLLAEAIPHPVWRSDAEGRQIDCNRRWQEYTGQTPEEAQGNGWMKALHPDDVAWAIQRVREDVPGGKIYQAEYRLRRASDNSYHWHLARAVPRRDANGTILGWFGSAVDIDDLKQAQEALQKAHDGLERRVEERTAELVKSNEELAMFQKFAAASGQGFSMADLDGHLLYLNPALCRMLSEEGPEDLIGQHLSICYLEESNRRGKQEIEPALKQRGYWEGELAMLSRHGKAVPTWQNAFIIRDESGNPVRMAVVVTDITARKQAEVALDRERQSLWRMLQASDHERQIISYEIHDGLAQYLAAAEMQFQVFDGLRASTPQEAKRLMRPPCSSCASPTPSRVA